MKSINKTQKSLLNSVTSVVLTLFSGLCNLIVVRKLIEIYGSDFNGLNSTATQFISVLMIIEGGFAVAANVALFKPLSNNNEKAINAVLVAVNVKFHKISTVFLVAGLCASILFTFVVNSQIDLYIRFGIFIMLVISTTFSLGYSTKYRILFQSDQNEYILNIISLLCLIVSNCLLYVFICYTAHPLVLRIIVMLFAIANYACIGVLCKKKYPYIDMKQKPDFVSIAGTSDVFAQKIVGVVYYAVPIIAISVFDDTISASVYAVFNTVIMLIRSTENAIINAPRMSLGRLIAEDGLSSERVERVFNEYEYCAVVSISLLMSVTTVLIMPFIRIYAQYFYDATYTNWIMALILIVSCYIECIHIPCGNLINMSGHFRAGKVIQLIAGAILLISVLISAFIFGVTGILIAVMVTAVALAVLEIGYVRKNIIKNSTRMFVRTLLVNLVSSIVLVCIELQIQIEPDSFFAFAVVGIIITVLNFGFLLGVNYVFSRNLTMAIIYRFMGLLKKVHK